MRSNNSETVVKKNTDSSSKVDTFNEFGTKRSGLDVFEFDEYDDINNNNNNNIRKDDDGSYRWTNLYRQSGSASRVETEDDESDLPLSVLRKKYKLSSGKSIRLQGKNEVLKVMVNDNKQTAVSHSSNAHPVVVTDNRKDNQKEAKTKPVHTKTLHTDARDEYTKTKNSVKTEVVKKVSKEINIKRSSGTEKQILREKIKDMLVAGGWTIDYRPRRGRNYMDAVYINPSGIGYWSIIKAYDAFQKEEANPKFTPLRNEIVEKLSRQSHMETENVLKTYVRKNRKIGRCSLLVREYDKNTESVNGFVPYLGKRTLLAWLVDLGVVGLKEPVEYMNSRKTRVLQKGWITKHGIHCSCCDKVVTVVKFEEHAGSKAGQPFLNMFLESGKSLMQCQIDAWSKQGELERKGFYSVDDDGDDIDDTNDDTCGLCGDGGDLICCDGCPSTFHQTCLDLPMLPQGEWLCPNCTCKYCESAAQDSLLVCYFCQKKYHETCTTETDKPFESSYPDLSFCGHMCHELYGQLQKLVGVKHDLGSGFSWSLIHRAELATNASSVELSRQVECNSMVAVAMSLMDECFLPFTDRRSGINLIRNVVFNCGSNLSRLNYSGFFTAILERGDEVVCAASIRIHGTQLAEMPFIGTRHLYRRQGMCRRLLSAIEIALSSLHVEKLIIPAVAERMNTWTDVFGFQALEESDKQQLKGLNMVVFPRTDMLQKLLVKVKTGSDSPKPSASADADLESNVEESTGLKNSVAKVC
ncbi:increased DNA methylation 1-like [Bidens hawaiensis]|uniref:increased DNA methylation 1-like n=1 Tax=Bidens hawaiensis TaxID=980011 RepID=UPI00404B5774